MQIYILLTEKCNLMCKMCIRGKQDGFMLNFDTLKNSAWIRELKNHDVVITGGEPSLHPDFVSIVKFLCDYANTVTITTNGTYNYYIDKQFKKDNLHIQVSIDGDREKHNIIRGVGTHEKAMSTIYKMDNVGINYMVASVVNRENMDSMKNLEIQLHELHHIKFWKLSYEMPFGNAKLENMITTDEWNNFVDEILNTARLRVKIKKIFPFSLYKERKQELEKLYKNRIRYNNCGSGVSKIYIYPNFEIYSCTCLTDFPLGNLTKLSLNEILNGQPIQRFKKYELINKICKECEYVRYCNGGCIGMSYHYFGVLGMGDIRCPKLHHEKKN